MLSWMDRLPTSRVAAMRELLLGWHPGPDEIPPADKDLPAPLAELYAVADGRPDVLGTQNGLYPPGELYPDPDEGLLVIGAENQGGFRWLIDPDEDDPTTRTTRPCGRWRNGPRRWPNGSRSAGSSCSSA